MRGALGGLALVALVALVSLVAGCVSGGPRQQDSRMARVAILSGGKAQPWVNAFPDGLRQLGWEAGSIVTEYRYAEGREERLPGLAAELVGLGVAAIVATDTPSALAAQAATRTIPIVTVMASDPVGTGLVAGLGRPGGNVTGLTTLSSQASAKRLELLREVAPGITRLAVLGNFGNPGKAADAQQLGIAAQALGVSMQTLDVRVGGDIEPAFDAASRAEVQALVVVGDPLVTDNRERVVGLAARYRLPAIFETADMVVSGGLMSYGPNREDMYRRAAGYTDRILKGANPAELPMEPARQFELAINWQAAQALGLTFPPSVRAQADQVIP